MRSTWTRIENTETIKNCHIVLFYCIVRYGHRFVTFMRNLYFTLDLWLRNFHHVQNVGINANFGVISLLRSPG